MLLAICTMCVCQVIRGRCYMFFLSGLQRKMGFAMVYIVVSISHQASKQDLKQEIKRNEHMEETQDWDVNNIVSDSLRGNITLNQNQL